MLIRNAGRVIPSSTLIARVWPRSEIYEDTLRVHTQAAAKIEPDFHHPTYIFTERGVGYRFRLLEPEADEADDDVLLSLMTTTPDRHDVMQLSSAPTQPEAETDADQQIFYRLTSLAAQTDAIEPLLSALAKELGVPALSISAPEDADGQETSAQVSVPLRYCGRLLGHLCAEAAPDASKEALAARMAFFSPVIALQLAMSMRCENELTVSPSSDGFAHNLRDELDRLEAVLDATNDAILLVDTHETLAMATPQFETFTGISRYDILACASQSRTVEAEISHCSPGHAQRHPRWPELHRKPGRGVRGH